MIVITAMIATMAVVVVVAENRTDKRRANNHRHDCLGCIRRVGSRTVARAVVGIRARGKHSAEGGNGGS